MTIITIGTVATPKTIAALYKNILSSLVIKFLANTEVKYKIPAIASDKSGAGQYKYLVFFVY